MTTKTWQTKKTRRRRTLSSGPICKIQEELADSPQKFAEAYAKLTGLDAKVSAEASKPIKLGDVVSPDQIKARPRRLPISASSRRMCPATSPSTGTARSSRTRSKKVTSWFTGGLLSGQLAPASSSSACIVAAGGDRPLAGRRPDGSLFGGVLPTPDRVWRPGRSGRSARPGSVSIPTAARGSPTLLFSAERVGKGFGARDPGRRAARHCDRLVRGSLPARSIPPSRCCGRSRSPHGCRFPSRCSASAIWARSS